MNQSVEQPMNQSVEQPMNQTMDQPTTKFVTINGIKYPFISDKVIDGCEFNIDAKVDRRHVAAISSALAGLVLVPMKSFNSHRDVYTILLILEAMGISQETQLDVFVNWAADDRWTDLWYPEYLYLCHSLLPESINFNTFIRRMLRACLGWATKSLELPEMKQIKHVIGLIEFITAANFNQVDHDDNFASEMNKKRDELIAILYPMLDPFSEESAKYFKYTPHNKAVWSCNGIAKVKRQDIFEPTVVDKATFDAKFAEFTCGLLSIPKNKDYPMTNGKFVPPKNSIIAGGFSKLLNPSIDIKHLAGSDIDIFIYGDTTTEKCVAYERWLDWFKSDDTFFALIGSVTSVLMVDVGRKIQIISTSEKTPLEIINRFDYTDRQWFYDLADGTVKGTIGAFKAFRTLTSCVNISSNSSIKLERAIKTLYYGFDIERNETMINDYVDITEFIKDPKDKEFQKMLRGFAYTYIPRSEPGRDREDFTEYITWMIEKETNAKVVSMDAKEALKEMVISGNFAHDYDALLYTNFSINKIEKPHGFPAAKPSIIVKNKLGGRFKALTCKLIVDKVNSDDVQVVIVTRINDAPFEQFVNTCENELFRHVRNRAANKKMIENGKLSFKIPMYKLGRQAENGVSLMQSQIGIPLSIEDELSVGDTVQIIFNVFLCHSNGNDYVEFAPIKIIKYQELDMDRIETIEVKKEEVNQQAQSIAYENVDYE